MQELLSTNLPRLQAQLTVVSSQMQSVNETLTRLHLDTVKQQISDLSAGLAQTQSAANVLQAAVYSDLIPRVSSIKLAFDNLHAFNATVFSQLQLWSRDFQNATIRMPLCPCVLSPVSVLQK